MPRLVQKTAHGPHIIQPQKDPVTICMCGLSKNQPFCDGSHQKTLDENPGKMYIYELDGTREEIAENCGCDECQCDKTKKK